MTTVAIAPRTIRSASARAAKMSHFFRDIGWRLSGMGEPTGEPVSQPR
jgi:hypothetical protein